jgi:K+-transporting ATPase ATPase B chain
MFSAELVVPALGGSLRKLHPAQLVRNPVLFTTAVVALLLTVLLFVGQTGCRLASRSS